MVSHVSLLIKNPERLLSTKSRRRTWRSPHHPARDFLSRHGDGINHLGICLDDLGPLKEKILKNGGRIINQGSFNLAADQRGVSEDMQVATDVYPLYELLQM